MGNFTRRTFLKRIGSAGTLSLMAGCAQSDRLESKKRPNVILIMTDDQGYGDMSCHGNPYINTPNLDKLYDESTRLTNFHVSPTCSPTRASLMTGRYCNRTGVWHTIYGRSLLRRDEITMADVFSDSGYRTGIFGKWHLGDNYPFRPQDRGFDEALVHKGGGIGNTQDYWGNDYFDDTYFRNSEPEKFSGYCTDIWFDEAIGFVEKNKRRPFFCYLSTNAPHGPYLVPEKYSKPFLQAGIEGGVSHFYGMIVCIDENLGRLMQRLKELDLEEDTILIFMTDNGSSEAYYDGGMKGRKGKEYDGGHRVPFFIRWPGGKIEGGKDVERITAHIDVLPTLIDLCGLEKPAVKFDGDSIVSLLYSSSGDWPDRTIITDSQRIEDPVKWRKSAVMTDRYRLVNGESLYDMESDPRQRKIITKERPQVVKKLCEEYEKWWADTSTRFGEYCRTIVGSKHENPVKLTSHDWHASKPWNQEQIRQGVKVNSFWAIEVAGDGEYEIELRRWPREADAAIRAAIDGGKALNISSGRIVIGDIDRSEDVAPDAKKVTFKVKLKKGKTKLQTWFEGEGPTLGAYYVYVKKVS